MSGGETSRYSGKGLTFWLLFVMFYCVFVTFPCGILGQVMYLIVSIPDLHRLSLRQSCDKRFNLGFRSSHRREFRTFLLLCMPGKINVAVQL